MKAKKKSPIKLIFGGVIAIVLMYAVVYVTAYFVPIPFAGVLWRANTIRHGMTGDVHERAIGLHKDDIVRMLGEPNEHRDMWPEQPVWVYWVGPQPWRALMVVFNENGIVINVWVGNPIHFLDG